MVSHKETIKRLVPCVLELILSLKSMKRDLDVDFIANKLDISTDLVLEVINYAVSEGLLIEGSWALTEKGQELVFKHRETFVHDSVLHHPASSGLWKSKVKNLNSHLKRYHGFNSNYLNSFKESLLKFNGRIEEIKPLSSLSVGTVAVVSFTVGGYGFVRRLAEMGLTPGVKVSVVRNAPLSGPIIISVRESSIALGRGVASRIFVKVLEA